MSGILLIGVGLLLIVAGIIVLKSEKSFAATNATALATTEKTIVETSTTEPTLPTEVVATTQTPPTETATTTVQTPPKETVATTKETAEEKGREFTKLIISKFDKKYFKLKEWRSDKYENGVYPEANKYPDLEFEFTLRDTKSVFAIECKWRKNYYKNGVEWAKEYQLKNYNNFAKERNIPVFVAIGVGGTPENPDEVFIVPLGEIKDNFISQSDLKKYSKADFKDKNFFFDSKTATLK